MFPFWLGSCPGVLHPHVMWTISNYFYKYHFHPYFYLCIYLVIYIWKIYLGGILSNTTLIIVIFLFLCVYPIHCVSLWIFWCCSPVGFLGPMNSDIPIQFLFILFYSTTPTIFVCIYGLCNYFHYVDSWYFNSKYTLLALFPVSNKIPLPYFRVCHGLILWNHMSLVFC